MTGRWPAVLAALAAGMCGAVVWQWWQSELSDSWALVLGGAGLIALYLSIAGRLLAEVLGRVLLALMPLVGIAVAIIFLVVLPMPDADALQPSLIAGTVIVAGWVATWLAAEYRQARVRQDTRRDVLLALRSEIFTAFQTLDATDWRANGRSVQAKIEAGGDVPETAYYPFTASESPPIVFQSVSGSIKLLSPETLEPVLRFYTSLTDLSTLAGDLQREDFARLSWQRRVAAHRKITDTRIATLYWSLQSITAINAALGVKHPEAVARSGKNSDIRVELLEAEN